jgi:pilus assembly protein CpaB
MRWNRRATIGILAILSGGLAAYAALLYLQQRPIRLASAQSPLSATRVVVAARDLAAGAMVGPEDVKVLSWPAGELPGGYADNEESIVGRGLIRSVSANEPILEAKLARVGAGAGLQVTIPEGMRAMSVKVDEVIGVAGFVLPGTRVDVISVIAPSGNTTRDPMSRVILQNVPALAAGQTTTTDEAGKPLTVTVITLMVVPGDAEKLALAASQGRIQLALRNTLDQEEVETNGVRVAALLSGPTPARRSTPASATPPTVTGTNAAIIEVYKGGARTLIKY